MTGAGGLAAGAWDGTAAGVTATSARISCNMNASSAISPSAATTSNLRIVQPPLHWSDPYRSYSALPVTELSALSSGESVHT